MVGVRSGFGWGKVPKPGVHDCVRARSEYGRGWASIWSETTLGYPERIRRVGANIQTTLVPSDRRSPAITIVFEFVSTHTKKLADGK